MNGLSEKDACSVLFRDYPDVVTVEQMARMLGISTKTAYRLLQEGNPCGGVLKMGVHGELEDMNGQVRSHFFEFLFRKRDICERSQTWWNVFEMTRL